MSGMLQASIRWCLTGLLLAVHAPVPGGSGPAVAGGGAPRAACCASKACCTVEHACAGGGGCAADDRRPAAVSHENTNSSVSFLEGASCHPEAARVGSAPTLDPIVFAAVPGPLGGALFTRPAAALDLDPSSRPSSPQVPPPRA